MTISFRLDGSCALVTGAARGLGQAMAIALAEAGADVAGVDVGNLDETRARVEAAGRKFAAIAENLRGTAAARHVVERAASALSRLDILVNNAGIIRRADSIDFTEADWDDVIDINLKSVFFLAQAAARQCSRRAAAARSSTSRRFCPSRAGSAYLPTPRPRAASRGSRGCWPTSGRRRGSTSTRSRRATWRR